MSALVALVHVGDDRKASSYRPVWYLTVGVQVPLLLATLMIRTPASSLVVEAGPTVPTVHRAEEAAEEEKTSLLE